MPLNSLSKLEDFSLCRSDLDDRQRLQQHWQQTVAKHRRGIDQTILLNISAYIVRKWMKLNNVYGGLDYDRSARHCICLDWKTRDPRKDRQLERLWSMIQVHSILHIVKLKGINWFYPP